MLMVHEKKSLTISRENFFFTILQYNAEEIGCLSSFHVHIMIYPRKKGSALSIALVIL